MKRSFFYFYKYCLQKKYTFIFAILLSLAAAISGNLINFALSRLASDVKDKDFDSAFKVIAITGFLYVFYQVVDAVGRGITDVYSIYGSKELRSDVMHKLHELDFKYHSNKNSGSLISAFKRGDSSFFNLVGNLNRRTFSIFIDTVVILITFAYLDYRLLSILSGILVADLFATVFLVKINLKTRREFNDEDDKLSGVIIDNMVNFETVKYFANEDYERKRLSESLVNWGKKLWNYGLSFRLIDSVTGFFTTTGIIISLIVAIKLYQHGELEFEGLILVLTLVTSFFPKFVDVVWSLREILKNLSDIEKYVSILDEEETVREVKNAKDLKPTKTNIDFANVYFDYDERVGVINGVNLKIKSGESVAFVGTSGAGKTTLAKLLMRFYDLKSGSIEIAGKDISKISKKSLRKLIGVVPQDAILFNNTIGFNIGYGNLNATQKDIEEASKIAKLYDFIMSLPNGFETIVGERGIKLSGGQRQRLAIARVFLKNPDIIIFDEATSQLDSESEKAIQEAFWKIAKDKTVIIIAHRLSTILKSDRIVVFENGKVAEIGSHKDLLDKNDGIYKKLWTLQKGGSIEV